MPPPRNFNEWTKRWTIFQTQINELSTYVPRQSAAINNADVEANIALLVNQLRVFSQKYFEFFFDSFDKAKLVEDQIRYPFEFVMRAALYHIDVDIQLIEQAVSQRAAHGSLHLDQAAKLSRLALLPAAGLVDNIDKVGIVTYFTRIASARILPYAPVAFIGVPRTSAQLEKDLLAIPHEIGHFVYWYGKVGTKPIPIKMREIIKPLAEAVDVSAAQDGSDIRDYTVELYRWAEEIFADVYGSLVGGPLMALSAQDLAAMSNDNEFVFDDRDHPAPVIRPSIYIHAYEKTIGVPPLPDPERILKALEDRWTIDIRPSRFKGAIPNFEFRDAKGSIGQKIPLNILNDVIKLIVVEIFDQILPVFSGFWTGQGLGPNSTLDTLEKSFNLQAIDILVSGVVSADLRYSGFNLLEWTFEKWAGDRGYQIEPNLDPVTKLPIPIPDDKWIEVLKAAGWTYEGPHGNDKEP